MTERANVDRYVKAGMSLWRTIQWIDRNVLRMSDPVVGWRAIFRETRVKPGHMETRVKPGHCWRT